MAVVCSRHAKIATRPIATAIQVSPANQIVTRLNLAWRGIAKEVPTKAMAN